MVIAAGVVFLLVGVAMMIRNIKKKERCSVPVEATVIGMTEKQEIEKDELDEGRNVTVTRYSPVVEYVIGSKTYKTHSSTYSTYKTKSPGDRVTIYYNPEDPTEVVFTAGSGGSSSMHWIAIGTGVVMIAIGIVMPMM